MKQWGIYYVDFGVPIGREQGGRRPAIIVKEIENMNLCIVIPLTSNLEAMRFRYSTRVNKTSNTKLNTDSVALLFQMGSMSTQRISGEVGSLADYQIAEIKEALKDMMQLQ